MIVFYGLIFHYVFVCRGNFVFCVIFVIEIRATNRITAMIIGAWDSVKWEIFFVLVSVTEVVLANSGDTKMIIGFIFGLLVSFGASDAMYRKMTIIPPVYVIIVIDGSHTD